MSNKKIVRTITTLTMILVFLGFYPFSLQANEKYEEKFEKTVAVAKSAKISLSNISGNIVVKAWDKAEVKIFALKTCREDSLKKAQENAGLVTIEVEKENDTLVIKTQYPKISGRSLSVSVDYQVTIPNKASLKVRSVSGDVTCSRVDGFLKVNSVSGNLNLEGAGEGADCQSVSGDIEVKEVKGDANLKTVSGDIIIGNITGSVKAESVSGDIKLFSVAKTKIVNVNTLSGDIDFNGDVGAEGSFTFKTHSGNLNITLPAEAAFEMEAKTFSGRIDSDFEISVSGKFNGREIRGTVNGGGADLTLKTFSGEIYLKSGKIYLKKK